MTNDDAILVLRHLSTGYRQEGRAKVVSRGLDARLAPGCFTCLLGANGAGKSTLLRTLSAFQPPLEGEIVLQRQPLQLYTPAQLSKLIGVVLTERGQVDELTVQEVVGLGRTPYSNFWGGLSKEDRSFVDEAIEAVGIEPLAQRKMHTLSDGERQKTMIAKVLAQQTPVILLDEPTAFLDFPSKIEMMMLLGRLAHERQKTVFLSTHDVELALQLADSLWLMDASHALQVGTPDELSANGAVERLFHREGIVFDAALKRFSIQR